MEDALKPMLNSLREYPQWFVVLCASLTLAVLLYILAKAVKWMLYGLIALVVIAGLGLAAWLLLR